VVLISQTSIIDDLKQINDEQSSDLSKVTGLLMDNRFYRRKTRANDRLIRALSVCDTLAQIWDIQYLKTFIPTFTQYLTSKDGKARQEIVDITKYSIDREKEARMDMINAMGRR